MPDRRALDGLNVVELAIGVSQVGGGMAVAVPGMFFADHGATVVRIEGRDPLPLDDGVEYDRVWSRGKRLLRVDPDSAEDQAHVRALLASADVVVAMASEGDLRRWKVDPARPDAPHGQVYCHIGEPGLTFDAPFSYDALVQAASGLMAMPRQERGRPIFGDLQTAALGTALVAITGVLAALVERERTGRGQQVTTSLYDGMFALLGLLLHRVERPTPATESFGRMLLSYTWLYQCADGGWVHLHPGARGAFERIEAVLADAMAEAETDDGRAAVAGDGVRTTPVDEAFAIFERWRAGVGRRDRAPLLAAMWEADVPAQPALDLGDALGHEHVRLTGLAVEQPDPDHGTIAAAGPAVRVRGFAAGPVAGRPASADDPGTLIALLESSRRPRHTDLPADAPESGAGPRRLLAGIRVLDFGNWVAGPLGDQVLADLGAEVIKVEGVDGDPSRTSDLLFFACQRGKRVLALDLKAPEAGPILEGLFAWADVVHHNFRPGVAERLGIDEASVRGVNPAAVYCHSPAFGSSGPMAGMAGFDQMVQAFTGVEAAGGGEGGTPMWYPWGPMDTAGGWLSAAAILLGLFCRARTGDGQYCESTQVGAGLLAKSGVFLVDGVVRPGPVLDADQTGYGPAYRIYRTASGWLALVVRDREEWARLRSLPGLDGLPERYVGLRVADPAAAAVAEAALEAALADRSATEWEGLLAERGIPSVVVAEVDHPTFVSRCFDHPSNRALGRVARFSHDELGWVEHPGVPFRFSSGPLDLRLPPPKRGEHSAEILALLGFDDADAARLLAVVSHAAPLP